MRRTIFVLAITAAALFTLAVFRTTPLRAPAGQAVTGPVATGTRPRPGGRWITGPLVQTPFGAVQVKARLAGQSVDDVQALQLPHDFSLSQQISAYAVPLLRREAIRAQSARIDTVSGATYTSQGYRQSLQAALDSSHG